MIAEPELCIWNLGSERLSDGFVRDHPGSLDCRIRNDAANCADANACNAYCYGCSDGELGDADTHFDPPSIGRAGAVAVQEKLLRFWGKPCDVSHGCAKFLLADLAQPQQCRWTPIYTVLSYLDGGSWTLFAEYTASFPPPRYSIGVRWSRPPCSATTSVFLGAGPG